MHYVPESARELLPDPAGGTGADDPSVRSFHYRSAPVYLLTAAVGVLLGGDLLLAFVDAPEWSGYRSVFGFRLALWAAVLGGSRILYQTLEQLFEGKIGADLALTIAAVAAIVLGEHETAALVVFIALCGESIEGYTIDRAQRSVRRIFQLRPTVAHLQRDSRDVDVPVDDVRAGDVLTVRPGERVPVDGRVTAGISTVDQSPLTGESLPVDKAPGDEVFTGTLNRYGALTVVAEKVGGETTLAQIVRLVAEAAARKMPLERTADRLARLFLPFVLAAAAATVLGWRIVEGDWSAGFRAALGVLVVACPCPLILATPTAVMAALARLARLGVVVKGSAALERLSSVDTFAFDKTGTLTRGELTLGDVAVAPGANVDEVIGMAAAVERRSEHPLARLIVAQAEARRLELPTVRSFEVQPGGGVVGEVAGADPAARPRSVFVGSRRFVESQGIATGTDFEARLTELERSGQTTLLIAVDGALQAVVGVRDMVRMESRDVLSRLKAAGVSQIALLTGDRPQVAAAVAQEVGLIDYVESGLLPQEKARWVEDQMRQGRRVAMVGDGVNDAPALATATVGVALGGVGSDLAAEAGDVVLLGDPLRPLPELLELSRQLVRNIRQSILFFAFGMNAAGVLLAATGVLSPVAAAVFHELASLAVMLNAMRLLWSGRWDETRLGRTSQRLSSAAEWLTGRLSPSGLTYALIAHRGLLLRTAAGVLALLWLSSGLVRIAHDEQALVIRFGRVADSLPPGLHWRWPAPLERVQRMRTDELRILELGFRTEPPADPDRPAATETAGAAVEWTSEHTGAGVGSVADEAVVLTADEVPVELTAELQYRISDLPAFLYGGSDPLETVRAAAAGVICETAAQTPLDGLLTEQRSAVEAQCLAAIRARIAGYGLGIEIAAFSLLDVHPPRDVVPAYRDVADALEEREQRKNEADAYVAGRLLSAAGEGGLAVLAASRRKDEDGEGAGLDWSLDEASWQALVSERAGGQQTLSGEAAATLNAARRESVATRESARSAAARFEGLLGVYEPDPALTRVELYWTALERALASRKLTIIDPAAAGRRHLMLIDPDRLGGGASGLAPLLPQREAQTTSETKNTE